MIQALKLDAYQATDAQRWLPNFNLAALLVHKEHDLAISLAKYYPPLWKVYWVITLKQLTDASFSVEQQALVKHLQASLSVCPSSFSLEFIDVLHANWFIDHFNTNALADETKLALRMLEKKLIERHGLEFVSRLLDLGDILSAARSLKDIVRINRQLATQKTFAETRTSMLTAGSMDEESGEVKSKIRSQLIFIETELLNQVAFF